MNFYLLHHIMEFLYFNVDRTKSGERVILGQMRKSVPTGNTILYSDTLADTILCVAA